MSQAIIPRLLVVIAILFGPLTSMAIQESRPLPVDSRLRVITYNPNEIHHYVGYYNYQQSILLECFDFLLEGRRTANHHWSPL